MQWVMGQAFWEQLPQAAVFCNLVSNLRRKKRIVINLTAMYVYVCLSVAS